MREAIFGGILEVWVRDLGGLLRVRLWKFCFECVCVVRSIANFIGGGE